MLPVRLRRWIPLLLLPLLLFGSVPAGAWHCADGDPCEIATALACCCGGDKDTAAPDAAHDVERPDAAADDCGCYYHAGEQPAPTNGSGSNQHPALLATAFSLTVPVTSSTEVARAAVEGAPPGHLISPSDTRGPPVAQALGVGR